MRRVITPITFALALASLASAQTPNAADPAALEAGLVRAMRPSADRTERLVEPGDAIRAYIAAGIVPVKPDLREEYTDYRVVRQPAKLFGQELMVIEEEYQLKFIGCCVNAGVGAILRVTGDQAPLNEFAAANGCSLSKDDVIERLRKLKVKSLTGEFVSLSCRERDLMK